MLRKSPYNLFCSISGLPNFSMTLNYQASAYTFFDEYKKKFPYFELEKELEKVKKNIETVESINFNFEEPILIFRSEIKNFTLRNINPQSFWADKIKKKWGGELPKYWLFSRDATNHAEILLNQKWNKTFSKIYKAKIEEVRKVFFDADINRLSEDLNKSIEESKKYVSFSQKLLEKISIQQ